MNETINIVLLVYASIVTFIIVGLAVGVIIDNYKIRGRFNRNLLYSDNVLTNHKTNMIEASKYYNSQVKQLTEFLQSLIEMCISGQEHINKKAYEIYLDKKYTENKISKQKIKNDEKIQEFKNEVLQNNIKAKNKAESDIGLIVDNGKELNKVNQSSFIGEFTNEYCPVCNFILIRNKAGETWCSQPKCDFGKKRKQSEDLKKEDYQIKKSKNYVEEIGNEGPTQISFDENEFPNNDINLIRPKVNEDTIERYNQNMENIDNQSKITLGDLFGMNQNI
jgi:hypothetical protein